MKKGQDIFIDLPGIKIIHHRIPGKELGKHHHKEHEFFLPISGEMKISYLGEDFTAGPGKMLYVPPNIEHTFSSATAGTGERLIWLISDSLWKKHIQEDFPITILPNNSLVKELIFYLLLNREVKGEKYFISALIESLNDSLESAKIDGINLELVHMLAKVQDPRIKNSLKLLGAKIEKDSLTEIATKSGMSQRNFNRLFLNETGLTPKEYLQAKRMDKAKKLLTTTDHTITDISLEVGYNSVSKFIEAFKKMVGILPSDYRHNTNPHR